MYFFKRLFSKKAIPAWLPLLYGLANFASTLDWLLTRLPKLAKFLSQIPYFKSRTLSLTLMIVGFVWLTLGVYWTEIKGLWGKKLQHLIGTADLLVVRLEWNDLVHDWKGFAADFGAFVRMSVASADKPRTVKGFVMEVRSLPDGVAYDAVSEREVGDYFYRHKQDKTNEYGYIVEETINEPMPDLMEKLRTPLGPATHVEGWVRFELRGVRRELKDCRIAIYAIDALNSRHEIETDNMMVRMVDDDHAYVVAKQR